MLTAISLVFLGVFLGVAFWFYVTMRIWHPLERRFTLWGELYTFLFFVAGLVGVLVAVSNLVGPIT
ncbi:MAG: hypothetical protein ABSD49_14090 [Candidatus Bathyarchaeia archaeon]